MTRKAFTVAEADALLPLLDAFLGRVGRIAAEVRERHEKLQVLDALWGDQLVEPSNPDHHEWQDHRAALTLAVADLERTVQEEIVARGIRFPQGGLEHGLLDFPTTWEGRWVYLCWRRGEPGIRAWHEVTEGFAGRQELTAEHEARMGREGDPRFIDDSMLDF